VKRTSNNKLRRILKRKNKPKARFKSSDLLSSGSTLLNLQCSGNPSGAYYKGGYFNFVGDSDSGKSMFMLSTFQEALNNPSFEGYKLIFDNAEGGALMNIGEFFSKELEDTMIGPPRGISETIEDFYFNLDELYEAEEPFIYILDSMDVLESEQDIAHSKKKRKAADKEQDTSGSFATAKPKANSAGLRRARAKLPKSGSILIIVSQTRDNIGFGSIYNPKTRSGGRAIKFYARLEIWSSCKGEITKTVMKKKRQLGIISKLQVKKNHITGKKGSVEIPIYSSYGLDDIGSCISYLVEEGHWSKRDKGIKADDFDFNGSEAQLIKKIEEDELEDDLKQIVAKVWNEIEEACSLKRKKKYQ